MKYNQGTIDNLWKIAVVVGGLTTICLMGPDKDSRLESKASASESHQLGFESSEGENYSDLNSSYRFSGEYSPYDLN